MFPGGQGEDDDPAAAIFASLRELAAKPCSTCRGPRDRPGQRTCRACHAAYQRRWRRLKGGRAALSAQQRKKANARSYAHVYRDRGLISPAPCEGCGRTVTQMHHPDYDAPATVVHLCRLCHRDEHDPDQP